MKKILNNFFIIIVTCLVLFFCSCNERPLPSILKINEKLLAELQLKNDTLLSIADYFQPYLSENVYFIDQSDLKIVTLSTNQLKLEVLCKIKDTLNYIESFVIDEKNKEILLFLESELCVYNFDGGLKEKHTIPNQTNEGFLTILNANFIPLKEDSFVYYHFFADIEETYKSSKFFKKPIEARVNLNNKIVETINQTYPLDYQNNCYGYNFAPDRFKITPNQHGFTFPYNDSLFIINTETNKNEIHFFGSHRDIKTKSISFNAIENLNSNVFDDLFLYNSNYAFSGYAPISNYFYRTLLYSFDGIKELKEKKSSLILYDSNLKYLGETDFNSLKGIIIDSKSGLLQIKKRNNHLLVYQLNFE